MSKISKEALCIRNTSSWANVKAEYKFDSSTFKKESVLRDLPLMSPKIDAMIKKINELDQADMASDGKYYKHIIYSDVAGTNGAKMVASSLIANNYTLIYNNGVLKKDIVKSNYTFGLLTTSVVNSKPLPVKLKKNMMTLMNNRENNVNGENMRFVILDSGFKEGIDVFDVKYMHILEPLITKAESTQVIGRGTRYCGQSGLPFQPGVGWSLNIYRYNINYDKDMTLHDLYIKHSNQNISAINFVADIEDIMIAAAVDLPLTENIHLLSTKNNRFYDAIIKIIDDGNNVPKKKVIKVINNIRGKIFTNEKKIDCKKKCQGVLEMLPEATPILIAAAIYEIDKIKDSVKVSNKKKIWRKVINKSFGNDMGILNAFNEKFAKPILCNYIDKRANYCDAINKIWLSPMFFFKMYGRQILDNLNYYKDKNLITEKNYSDTYKYVEEYYIKATVKKPEKLPVPPPTKLKNRDLYNYVFDHFKPFKWDYINVKNKCIVEEKGDVVNVDNADAEKAEKANKNYEIVTYSNTQSFVQNFLTPSSPYKGLFLFHSVGSGKTCTAIATATNSFDKEGYTILWVTRHTLKEDIWKNMFDKICSVIIRERLANGEELPKTRAKRMEFLGKNWVQPISYKQFTNLIKGKNKFYAQMVKRNGEADPFKKTLIIVDEIHKIYSSSLSTLEKPNPDVLQEMIQRSYAVSGNDSLKLLLMSATPVTDDPMSSVKILNLLLEKDERFPENFEDFKELYCNENGLFNDIGSMEFINRVSGIISYIDRSNDRSQFAYPVMNDIIINIKEIFDSNSNIPDLEQEIEDLEEKKKNVNKALSKAELKVITANIKSLKKELKEINKQAKEPKHIIDYVNKCFEKKKTAKAAKTAKAVMSA
jgi:hypothetical protein